MNIRRLIRTFPLFFLLACESGQAQEPPGLCIDPEFDRKVHSLLSYSVPVKSVADLRDSLDRYLLLDAREAREYTVSHIPGARYVGYDAFDPESLEGLDRDKPVVVYCSVGYRSEKIGERLKKAGFKQVYNLYGSIFEWVNRGYPVVDMRGDTVQKVHTYNRNWSRWVDGDKVEKEW